MYTKEDNEKLIEQVTCLLDEHGIEHSGVIHENMKEGDPDLFIEVGRTTFGAITERDGWPSMRWVEVPFVRTMRDIKFWEEFFDTFQTFWVIKYVPGVFEKATLIRKSDFLDEAYEKFKRLEEMGLEVDLDTDVPNFCPYCGDIFDNKHSCYGTQGENWEAARMDEGYP